MNETIYFFSSAHYEMWDWTNSVEKGIGGSETSAVEMAWRLARRGYKVVCYAPVPWEGTKEWRGTTWTHYKNADFKQKGLWVLYRCPDYVDKFGAVDVEQPRWFMCQDAHYADGLNAERAAKLDRVIALCDTHAWHLKSVYPKVDGKLWITSNGVKVDLIREIEKELIVRNPYKLVYASSPDRGLVSLLQIFKKAKEIVPQLELHVYYGFNNIDQLTRGSAPWKDALIKIKKEVETLAKQDGVFLRGRINQKELYREWLSAGIWCYPTDFTETSCITCMEAQAMGAIPITNPIWALRDNVAWGISIEGHVASDELVKARYVGEIVRLTRNEEGIALQETIRAPMMNFGRSFFNWERFVDQWESDILGLKPAGDWVAGQFTFQHKHAKGKVLNVGCDCDHTGWMEKGAVNVDVVPVSPITKNPNRYHLLHDARNPFPASIGKFDTVILGDIMEHIQLSDWNDVLINCKNTLNDDGIIIITCPDDGDRERLEQHLHLYGNEEYVSGCSAFHTRYISHEEIRSELKNAGLEESLYQTLDYSSFVGHAIIASKIKVHSPMVEEETITVRGRKK